MDLDNTINYFKNQLTILGNDELYQIMLNASSAALKSLSQINHYTQKLCYNRYFWQDKYIYNNLHLSKFDYADHYKDHLHTYCFMESVMNNTNIIMEINKLETARAYNQTKGIVIIYSKYIRIDSLNDLLQTNLIKVPDEIKFRLIKDGYRLSAKYKRKATIPIGYRTLRETQKIMSYCLSIADMCYDDLELDFLDDKMFYVEEDITKYRNGERLLRSCLRQGLCEGLLLQRQFNFKYKPIW